MGLMDRIKKVTGTNDSYDDSYDDDYYQGFDNGYDDGAMPAGDEDIQFAGGSMGSTQQISPQGMGGMNMGGQPVAAGGNIGLSGSNIKMKVVYPKKYDGDTASQIANNLLNKCTVILNLEQTNKETSRRLIDFLTGVAYSIGGTLKRISEKTYVVTPANIDVDEEKIKPASSRREAQPEARDDAGEDFSDFN